MTSIHDRVRLTRRAARNSQSELASLVGVNRSAVAQWERPNGAKPTMENLLKIAIAGSVMVEWLATGRGPMSMPGVNRSGDQLTDLQLSEFALNDDEQRVLRAFRSLERRSVGAIVVLAESLALNGRKLRSDTT